MLEDNNGGTSSLRVVMVLWLLILFLVWLIVSIATMTLAEIPTGVLTLTGTLVGGKVIQRMGETPYEQ